MGGRKGRMGQDWVELGEREEVGEMDPVAMEHIQGDPFQSKRLTDV